MVPEQDLGQGGGCHSLRALAGYSRLAGRATWPAGGSVVLPDGVHVLVLVYCCAACSSLQRCFTPLRARV
jgi:hypothetical protein